MSFENIKGVRLWLASLCHDDMEIADLMREVFMVPQEGERDPRFGLLASTVTAAIRGGHKLLLAAERNFAEDQFVPFLYPPVLVDGEEDLAAHASYCQITSSAVVLCLESDRKTVNEFLDSYSQNVATFMEVPRRLFGYDGAYSTVADEYLETLRNADRHGLTGVITPLRYVREIRQALPDTHCILLLSRKELRSKYILPQVRSIQPHALLLQVTKPNTNGDITSWQHANDIIENFLPKRP